VERGFRDHLIPAPAHEPARGGRLVNRAFMRALQAARLSGEGKLDDALDARKSAIADATTAITTTRSSPASGTTAA